MEALCRATLYGLTREQIRKEAEALKEVVGPDLESRV